MEKYSLKGKRCGRCHIVYEDVDANFYKCSAHKDGYNYTCKHCERKLKANWEKKNRKYVNKQAKKNYHKRRQFEKMGEVAAKMSKELYQQIDFIIYE